MARAIPPELIIEDLAPPLSGFATAILDEDVAVTGYRDRAAGYPLIVVPFLVTAKNITTPVTRVNGQSVPPPVEALEIFE